MVFPSGEIGQLRHRNESCFRIPYPSSSPSSYFGDESPHRHHRILVSRLAADAVCEKAALTLTGVGLMMAGCGGQILRETSAPEHRAASDQWAPEADANISCECWVGQHGFASKMSP